MTSGSSQKKQYHVSINYSNKLTCDGECAIGMTTLNLHRTCTDSVLYSTTASMSQLGLSSEDVVLRHNMLLSTEDDL